MNNQWLRELIHQSNYIYLSAIFSNIEYDIKKIKIPVLILHSDTIFTDPSVKTKFISYYKCATKHWDYFYNNSSKDKSISRIHKFLIN